VGKNKGGRPKFQRGKQKSAIIALRATKEERKLFNEAAKRSGMKLSDWIRDVLLPKKKPPEPERPKGRCALSFVDHGEYVLVETPEDLSEAAWKHLVGYMEVIKPHCAALIGRGEGR
jgi:hypothetical protein